MEDSAPQERPFQCLRVGSLEEALVPPNIIRPVMEIKTTKPDERKGMVPPSLIRPPIAAQPPLPNTIPPVEAQLPPPNTIPPVEAQPSQHEKPCKSK